MNRVYVALGSNLGVPSDYIERALEQLSMLPETQLEQVSPWYISAPVGGPENQPDYLNAACLLLTKLSPKNLLARLHTIEAQNDRKRDVRWGARTLDLDIIWYEGFTSTDEQLTVPHPRAHLRAFVLKPLLDLHADFQLVNQNLDVLLSNIKNQPIEPYK
jgi:2-amino-4-hydroxy-6-hydroxymethyldihydropteridine diphosphokinase